MISAHRWIITSVLAVLGCASLDTQQEEFDLGSDALVNPNANLHYEGSCQFLLNCSTPSKGTGMVNWGCRTFRPDWEGGSCSSADLWVAVPPSLRGELCATKVRVCRNGVCRIADAKDVSVVTGNNNYYEGSPALLSALAISYSENVPSCSGTGTGTVTISSGSWSSVVSETVAPGTTKTVSFAPGVAGNHVLEYALSQSQSGSLAFTPFWKSNASPTWTPWSAAPATVTARRLPLYSGSSDVQYKFDISNTSSVSRAFVYRKLVGLF